MTVLTQEAIGVPATRPATLPILAQSDILSIASSVIQTYPSITSAYLFGSYAKGTARPDSDVDIVIFLPNLQDKLEDIGGLLEGLESALGKKVDLSVCPPDDSFVEKIKTYWVPINLQCETVSFTRPATLPILAQSDILSTASSVIHTYPSITSTYLFGSYAKGTARPDSDVDIVIFLPNLRDKLEDIGGVLGDLESAFMGRKVNLSVCPPDDFVEKINAHWVPIDLR